MEKINIGTNTFVYPNPVTLLGANVEGRANFMSLGWVSRVNAQPPLVGVGVGKVHHTVRGILENKTRAAIQTCPRLKHYRCTGSHTDK